MKKPTKDLVESFLEWFRNNPHAENENFYAKTVACKHLTDLPREQFTEFFFQFAHNGGKIQSGGYRTAPFLKKTMI